MVRRASLFLNIALLVALIGLAAPFTPPSQAARILLTVRGGPLGFTTVTQPQLAPVVMSGFDQVTTGTLGLFDIRDGRGTGAGWNLVAQASNFTDVDDPSLTISASGLSVPTAPTVLVVAGNAPPQVFAGSLGSPLKLLSAVPDTAMGRYQTEPPLELAIPADIFAGTYESTLTITLTSGP